MSSKFIVMYCNEGLECVIDVTNLEHDQLVANLAGREFKMPFNIATMILRARANSQRHYEIYAIETDDSISKEDIEELFTDSPQTIVDLIRSNGNKIFSDRLQKTVIS